LSCSDPIPFRPRPSVSRTEIAPNPTPAHSETVAFNRQELSTILGVYGRHVAAGEWRDYAMDFGREKAVFSVFRRASEVPLFRIEKSPKLARKQGAFSVVAASGLILKRGADLRRVLQVFDQSPKLV
jgi:Protein of unknown function (DUF2794)